MTPVYKWNHAWLGILLATACGTETPPQGAGRSADESWQLADSPAIDIGIAEGNETDELAGASGSVRLPDGRIVIGNSGTSELRIFDGNGIFLRSIGRKGEGPGEFLGALQLVALSDTSFAVFDQGNQRLSVFDTTGTLRSESRAMAEGQNDFPLWVWLYKDAWIVGPADTMLRGRVAAGIDALPPLAPGSYRYVQVAADGRIWAQERLAVGGTPRPWDIFTPDGALIGRLTVPANTEVHQVGAGFVLLRSWAENDVEHIQLYRFDEPPADSPVFPADTSRPSPGPAGQEVRPALAAGIRDLVMAQEMFYMNHAAYATNADSLKWEAPDASSLQLMAADKRGWVGVLVHRTEPALCGMAVGGSTPPGWIEGSPKCSR
jgi:hypothetical protein